MKYLKKGVLIFLILILGIIIINYNSGTPIEKLVKKYTYPESRFFEHNGMKVHYRITGKGPALVLIHGVASSLHTWEGWHKELSNDFTVISIDVPGFGLTGPNPTNDYSVQMNMTMLDSLLDELGISTCFMAGNSYGGYLTWNYALHNKDRVKKIILLDAGGFNTSKKTDNPGFKLAMNPFTKKISHKITPYFIIKKSVENVYGDKSKVTDSIVQQYYDLILREGNREAFSEILLHLHSGKNNDELIKKVTQPTLIMWGSEDSIINANSAVSFNNAINNSELIIYSGIGHIPMEEIPVKSANDARKFLLVK